MISTRFFKQSAPAFLAGAFIAGALSIAPLISNKIDEPYYNVQVIDIHRLINGDIKFKANFIKNDACTFADLQVYGRYFDIWERLAWEDPQGESGDRLVGNQTLTLVIKTGTVEYDLVEIRTRHVCGGAKKRDRVFSTVEIDEK